MAKAYELSQKFEEASRYYLLVATLYQDNDYGPRAMLSAGDILKQLGRKEEALKVYKEIPEDYPQSPLLEEVLKKIKEL